MVALAPTSNPYADQGDQSDGFIVRVYNKAMEYQGILGGYESLVCVRRHNAISTAELIVRADHPRVPEMLLPGARLVIDYDHELLMSGRMESRGASANAGTPVVTFNLVSDFQYIGFMLGWPNPDDPIDQQGTVHRYWRDEGLATNVAQRIISHAKQRLGLNLIVYGDPNPYVDMGPYIHIRSRMDNLADVLIAKLDRGGIGIGISGYGTNGQHYLGFYETTVRDKVLTADSGAIIDWSWTQAEPTVTRVVIGAAGEGTSREYHTFVDTDRETLLGTIKEAFVDAREIGSDYEDVLNNLPGLLKDMNAAYKSYTGEQKLHAAVDDSTYINQIDLQMLNLDLDDNPTAGPVRDRILQKIALWQENYARGSSYATEAGYTVDDFYAEWVAAATAYNNALAQADTLKTNFFEELAEKAQDVFHEFGTQYGLSLTLAETPGFRYGTTFKVGDTVTVELPGSITITDVVREVTISDTVESGLTVEPVIGTQDTMAHPNRILVGTIKRLMQAARKLNSSR